MSGPAGSGQQNYYWWNLPSNLWVNCGSTFFSWTSVYVNSGEQFVIKNAAGSSPITASGTYSANYQKQYLQKFVGNGLGNDATGSFARVTLTGGSYGTSGVVVQMTLASPSIWVDSGAIVHWSYLSPVASSVKNKEYLSTGSPSTGSYTNSASQTITLNFVAFTGLSSLQIQVGCPVNILVTDQSGQREGADASGNIYDEIPGAAYTGPSSDPQIITLPGENVGSYVIQLFATGTGPFTVTVTNTASDGSTAGTETWTGSVTPGETLASSFTVNSDGSVQGGTAFALPEYFLGALAAMAACFIAFYFIRKPKLPLTHTKNI